MRARCGAEPQQRMLEQRQQRHRLEAAERGFGRQPREHAGWRVGERVAAGIVDRHVPALERGHHAARQRAVGRHQRGGLVLAFRPPRAAPPRWRALLPRRWRPRSWRAMPSALVGGGVEILRLCALPASARWWRPAAAPPTPAARGRAVRARQLRPRRCARCRCARAAPAWRIAHGRRRARRHGVLSSSSPAISAQEASSRSVSRPGSTTRAVRQPGDGGEQLGGRRHRAGGAGGDHRRVAAGKPLGLGLDQPVAALGRLRWRRARRAAPARPRARSSGNRSDSCQ